MCVRGMVDRNLPGYGLYFLPRMLPQSAVCSLYACKLDCFIFLDFSSQLLLLLRIHGTFSYNIALASLTDWLIPSVIAMLLVVFQEGKIKTHFGALLLSALHHCQKINLDMLW